jgi:hypothetical protein
MRLGCLDRLTQLYEARGVPFAVTDGKLFILYGQVICSIGPAKFDYTLSRREASALLGRLPGALVQWTDGFSDREQPWYAVICDRFVNLADMGSKKRWQTKRALEACEVRRVDADFVAAAGYEVYVRAFDRFRGVGGPPWDEAEFKRRILANRAFDDLIHFWAAFQGKELIGFFVDDVYDRVEVNYSMGAFHPDHMKAGPAYALIHRMNEYYLGEQGFEYVNDGWRSLLHETDMQGFLIQKFGFRKAWARLSVRYRWPYGPLVRATFPFRKALGRLKPQLSALYKLEAARRECAASKAEPPGGPPQATPQSAPGDESPGKSGP